MGFPSDTRICVLRIISNLEIDHWSLEKTTESITELQNVPPTGSSRLCVMISLHSLFALNKIALQPKRVYKNTFVLSLSSSYIYDRPLE